MGGIEEFVSNAANRPANSVAQVSQTSNTKHKKTARRYIGAQAASFAPPAGRHCRCVAGLARA